MSNCELIHRLDPIINKANKKQRGKHLSLKKGAEENVLQWPCPAPFSSENTSYGIAVDDRKDKPVAHVIIPEKNLGQIKQVG